MEGSWVFGTDIGGTFTDLVGINETGEVVIAKVPSTPPAFENGIRNALDSSGVPGDHVQLLLHGTTVATNAVITKHGARTGVITTEGFRDLLELRRGNRGVLYDLMWDPPQPLALRRYRLGVPERVSYAGEVLQPLDEERARDAVGALKAAGVEAIAVCFLNSFANPANELRMKEIVAEEFPEAYCSVSSEILPQPPEFERTATVVANAYLGPLTSRYLRLVTDRAATVGFRGDVLVMHSGGGLLTVDAASEVPVRLANSGPAAGVIAAAAIGRAKDRKQLISLDMGGTSADIALILDGAPRVRPQFDVEWGLPALFPSVDIVAIGAGGGSIAWLDPAGYPKSGPQSAGASPGPACYGLGGEEPTNTDANLTLGRLSSESFLGGRMKIDLAAARSAIQSRIADPLGLGVEEAAAGIIAISNANMVGALRLVTIQRGYDPREMSLIAFGGAGPLHCVDLARELEIPEVIVPPLPGITSALGLLFADLIHDFSRTYQAPVDDVDVKAVEAILRELEAAGIDRLVHEGQERADVQLRRAADFHYAGQARTITVPLGQTVDAAVLADAVERFHREHQREFGYARPEFSVELSVLRVSAIGVTRSPQLSAMRWLAAAGRTRNGQRPGRRPVFFADVGFVESSVYERATLEPGAVVEGPAILEELDSTTLIPPGVRGEIDEFYNVVITL